MNEQYRHVVYGDKEVPLKPTKLPVKTLTAVGRLIRAFAEIEDMVTLYICNLAEINESRAVVLLGKTAITRRLEMAQYLAQMTGKKITALHSQIWNDGFRAAMTCRNTVAHGVLLGRAPDKRYAFLTAKTEPPTGKSAIQVTVSYRHEDIAAYAKFAEDAIPLIEKHLKLQALRQARLRKPLLPHRKSQPRRSQDAKQKPPPRPSRE